MKSFMGKKAYLVSALIMSVFIRLFLPIPRNRKISIICRDLYHPVISQFCPTPGP